MIRRGRFIAVAAVLGAGLLAIVLLPGSGARVGSASNETKIAVVSASSPNPDLLRRLDAQVAPPPVTKADIQPDTSDLAKVQPVSLTTAADFATPAVAQTTAPDLKPDTIGASAVNLRSGPSSGSPQLLVLQPGEAVQTGETIGGWVKVTRSDGTSGWVYSNYLSSNAAAQAASRPSPAPVVGTQARAVIKGDNGDLEDRTARIASRLTAYDHPGDTAEAVMTFSPGTRVRIAEVRGNWLRVETGDGTSAWIRR